MWGYQIDWKITKYDNSVSGNNNQIKLGIRETSMKIGKME
jgi:hypothetical protein